MYRTCENCDAPLNASAKHFRQEIFSYRGRSLKLNVISLRCEECGHEIDLNSKKRLKRKERFRLLADGFLTDEDIKGIRKKLKLSQRKLAEKLGVGEKTFARYETGSVRQSRTMDNLLRLIDVWPKAMDLIEEHRQSWATKKK